jgi:hypothetical protein
VQDRSVHVHECRLVHGVNMRNLFAHSINFKSRLTKAAFGAAVFSLLTLFVVRYVGQEKFIYFWDYVSYHNLYIELGARYVADPLHALTFVLRSVRGSDYNSLPPLFLIPFCLAFGTGRLPYILSITITFVFPAIVLFSFVLGRLRGRSAAQSAFDDVWLSLMSALGLALLPQLWVPVLLGYVDVGGLIIIFIVLMLYFRADLLDQSFGNLVSIALLLSLLIMYRRWYAYWVVGFFGALAVCEALRCTRDRERRTHCTLIAKNALILGGISFLSFFAIATPIARKMLTTDYGDIYSAYRSSQSIVHNLGALYDHFGLLTLVLAGLGIVFSGMNDERRPIVYFLCVQFAIAFVLFARTQNFTVQQNFGVQHFYLVLATVALFLSLFVQDVFMWIKTRLGKAAFILVFLLGSMANFAVTFLPRADELLKPIDFALPRLRQYPMVRTDLDQVQALLSSLNDISKESDSTIYILASSFTLNSSIVYQACFALQPPHYQLAPSIAQTNDVDKRDGFPIQFLRARYVVLTIPFGYHLAPQDQRVIGVLADQLVKGEGIGKSYDRLNFEFRLEDGSSAFIYRKARPLDPAAVRTLSDLFLNFYPNHKDKFEISSDLIREVSAK